MFEILTDEARRVVLVADLEAKKLNHSYIQPIHLLLGLLNGNTIAVKALKDIHVNPAEMKEKLYVLATPGEKKTGGTLPYSAGFKKVLTSALKEALQLGHNSINTGHILLGIVKFSNDTGSGDITTVLKVMNITLSSLRLPVANNSEVTKSTETKLDKARVKLDISTDELQGLEDTFKDEVGQIATTGKIPFSEEASLAAVLNAEIDYRSIEESADSKKYTQLSISPKAAALLRDVSKKMSKEMNRRVTLSETVERLVDFYG